MTIWKEFKVSVVLLSPYYSRDFCGGTDGRQDSMSWLKFEQHSIRVKVQQARLSYAIGNLKMSRGQLKVNGFLPISQKLAIFCIFLHSFTVIACTNVLWVILNELQVFCSYDFRTAVYCLRCGLTFVMNTFQFGRATDYLCRYF